MKTIYDFSVKDRKGKDVSLKEYANEVLLIVNTATKCGFTPQYDELEALYKKYHAEDSRLPAPTRVFTSSVSSISAQSSHASRRSR